MSREAFKIWRNPDGERDPVVYMGEYYPPNDQHCFHWPDLVELGFAPGHYTVRVPDSLRKLYVLPQWQSIQLPK